MPTRTIQDLYGIFVQCSADLQLQNCEEKETLAHMSIQKVLLGADLWMFSFSAQ